MPRRDRAKQFSPFNALKGLQDALRIKEYEHDRIEKGDLSEDAIAEIGDRLLNLQPNEEIKVRYYDNGFEKEIAGPATVNFDKMEITVGSLTIKIDAILSCD